MRYRKLGQTGVAVSAIGFGASPLGNVFRQTDPGEAIRAVHLAIDEGINLFDVSPYYGKTLAESRLGEALEGRRHQVFLATKAGRYGETSFDFSADRIKKSIDESLSRLKTDYVDLLQAHDIEFGDVRQVEEETIPALRELQRAGKTRFIGITSYQLQLMASVGAQAPVDTVLSYCRYDLLIDDMDDWLTPWASAEGVGLINASPLHMGILTEGGAPSWHPAPEGVRKAGQRVVNLCKSRGVDPGQIALRFCLDHPYAASTLVGMSSTAHVRRNLMALEGETDPQLLADIREAIGLNADVVWPSGLEANHDHEAGTRMRDPINAK